MKHNLKFGLVVGWLAVLKNSAILVNILLFYVFMSKTNKKLEFLYIVKVR